MRLLVYIFLFIVFIPPIWSQNPSTDNEFQIIRNNKLEFLSGEMKKHYNKRNIDSCYYYVGQIEAISDLDKSKDYYLKAITYKADFLFDQTKYHEADSIYKFILANLPKDAEAAASINLVRSGIYTVWGRYTEAVELANLAKDSWNEEQKTNNIVRYYIKMGNTYVRWEKIPEGLEYHLKAYQYALDNNQISSLGSILYEISSLYADNNVSDMAIWYAKEAEKYNKYPSNNWLIYNQIIEVYNKLGLVDSSAFYIEKALAIDTMESFTPHHNIFYCNRCEYYVLKEDYDKAFKMGMKALEFAEGSPDNYKVFAYQCLANLSYAKKDYTQAIKYVDTIEILGEWFLDNSIRDVRANSFMKQQKWTAASKDLSIIVKKASNQSRSNNLFKFNNNLLNEKFELKKKEADLLAKEAKAKLFNQRLFTFIMASLFIISLLIIHFFRKLYKKKEAYASVVENQNEELEKMNEFNHRLFYTLGHDLRSPINSLEIIFNELLKKRISTPDFLGILPTLKKSITGTSLTLNNILQWGLIQNSKVLKDRLMSDVNLHSEVLEVEGMLSSSMKLKNISFLNLIPEDYVVLADNYKINLIFRNLISNAIKFTPKSGLIQVSAEVLSSSFIIKIKDSGIGIEEHRLENLFDNKASTAGTNKEKGFGVGLPLCKEIILQMNGKIWVESILGEGSSFFVQIPRVEDIL